MSAACFAQRRVSVSGFVCDRASGERLIAAEVVCGDTGVTTDAEGRYSIVLESGKNSLLFCYSGFKSERLELNAQRDTVINVALDAGETLDASMIVANSETGFHLGRIDAVDIPLETVKTSPVVLGESDVLKTVQLLPGIQGGMEGFAGIYVRGGGADENLFLLDGVPLYNVSHLLGVFSAFTPEAIKKASMYKGAFPARYGGRTSGVLDLRMVDGDLYQTHGAASVGLIASKVHLNGPIIKGKTSYALSGRLMHTALLAPVVNIAGNSYTYYFYDLNGKIVHRISDNDRLFLSVYQGEDVFNYRNKDVGLYSTTITEDVDDMTWGNTVAALRWHHVFDGIWSAGTMLSYNRYGMNTRLDQTLQWEEYLDKRLQEFSETYESRLVSSINDFSFSFDAACTPSNVHNIKTGISLVYHTYTPSVSFTVTDNNESEVTSFEERGKKDYSGWESALYAEDDIRFSGSLSANLGLRFVLMTSGATVYPSLQPRLSVQWMPDTSFSVKAGYARMGQYVHRLSSSRLTLPSDLWVPVTDRIRPVVSDIGSAGVFFNGLPGWELSLEGYYKYSDNVIDYKDGASMLGSAAGWEELVEMGQARSYGLEMLVRRSLGPVKGWLAYTLSKTERRYPEGYINNGEWFPFQYDRRHVVNLYLDWSVTEAIRIGATWSFASGSWITVPERTVVLPNLMEDSSYNRIDKSDFIITDYISSRNNYNLPPSHYLNLSVNFDRKLRHGERTITVGVYNVYNAMNPNLVYAKARKAGEPIVLERITFLPVLPSFNYSYKF